MHPADRWTSFKPSTKCCATDETSLHLFCNVHWHQVYHHHPADMRLHILKSGQLIYLAWPINHISPCKDWCLRVSSPGPAHPFSCLSLTGNQCVTAEDGKTGTEECDR